MKNFISIVVLFAFMIFCMTKCGGCSSEQDLKGYNEKTIIQQDTALARIEKNNMINEAKINLVNLKKFEKTKAGKLQKKHPGWSVEDCNSVIARQIWIGMEYDMLVAERGRPNKINQSNYGSGIQYQFCWDDYNPKYFYSKEDQIITSYN